MSGMPIYLKAGDLARALPVKPPRMIRADEGRVVSPLGLSFKWKATGQDTGYAFAVYEMALAPGTGIPMHTHPFAEFFYVLEGAVEVNGLDGDGLRTTSRAAAGESALAPANAPHGLHNGSDAPARFLSVANFEHEEAFNRIERAMAEAGAATMPGQQQAELFIGLAAESQVFFLGEDG